MLKRLIAKGHAEFSGGKQQDALEFWHYFIDQIRQKEHVHHVDPADVFNFQLQVSPASSHCSSTSSARSKKADGRCEGRIERLSISAPTDLKSAPGTSRAHLS